jgi:uncharacterized membrane protein
MKTIYIEKLKKRFLDGEITALEYEEKLKILESDVKDIEIDRIENTKVDSSIKKEDTSYNSVVMIVLVIIFLVLFIVITSKPKPTNNNIVKNEPNIVTEKTKREKSIEDSLYQIEAKKREKAFLAEEAAFMKTKAGKIYKKHPEWSREDCERLANNRIWIGMDIDMLKYKRGLPNSANPSNYGGVTQWQWCWSDFTPSCFYDNDGDGKIDSYN